MDGEPAHPAAPPPGSRPAPGARQAPPRSEALVRFENWIEDFQARPAADRTEAFIEEGRQLAAGRRPVLARLILSDPRAALVAAVPMVVRQRLPAEIVALLEERVSGRGTLALNGITPFPGQVPRETSFRTAMIDGEEYRAHVFGRRSLPGTVDHTSMHGVALDGHVALAEAPLRVLEPGEVAGGRPVEPVCGVSGIANPIGPATPLNLGQTDVVAVEFDGRVHMLCGARHYAQTESRLLAREESNVAVSAAAGGPGSSGVSGRPSADWTHGTKRLLIIRVDFSDRPGTPISSGDLPITEQFVADIVNATDSVRDFFRDNSFGQTALLLAAPVGGDSPDVSPVLRMPQASTYYAGDGIDRSGTLHDDARAAAQAAGFNVDAYDRVGVVFSRLPYWWAGLGNIAGKNFWINADFHFRIVTHEIGHTYGVWHANWWRTSDGNPASRSGYSEEYGDAMDVMGNGVAINYHFSHWHKSLLHWIPDSAVTSATSAGTYRIHRLDSSTPDLALPRALKIACDNERDFWIGYRAGMPLGSAPDGAYVLWGYNFNKGSDLLNASGSTTGSSYESPLPIGATFTDAPSGVVLRPVGRGGSGADQWMDVEVGFQPRVRWSQAVEYIVGEHEGNAVLRLVLEGDSTGPVSVTYATANGTATAGADYSARSGTVSWTTGDASDKFISIPVTGDSIWEAGERFAVALSGATGASIAGAAQATVAILDTGIRDFSFLADPNGDRVEKVLILPDGRLVVGGWFRQVQDARWQTYTRSGIAQMTADGALVPEFAAGGGISGEGSRVYDLARQPDGRIVMVGTFAAVHGVPRGNIARLNADGTLDNSFTASANGEVWATLVQPDGRIVIGGAFTSVNGVPREALARLNPDGTLDTTFVGPNFDGGWISVVALAMQGDGRLLAAGAFSLSGDGLTRSSLCRLLADGALDSSLSVGHGGHEAGNPASPRMVWSVAAQADGRILIGGDFTMFNGVARERAARLLASGTVDSSFNVSSNSRINAILPLPDGRVTLGGLFTVINGITANRLALVSSTGTLDTNMAGAGGFAGEVKDIQLLANGRIQFSGEAQSFQHSSDWRPVWRMISGAANPPGMVEFTAAAGSGPEGGSVTLTVNRTGGSGGAITVGYATVAGTAGASDYTPVSGVLTWAAGDTSPRTITVALTRDAIGDPAETFTVNLGEPALGGVVLGTRQQATVTIQPVDSPPPPPEGWQTGDVGTVGAPGGSSESGGVVSVSGSGADIWGAADAFHFRSQMLTGDGAIIARVASTGNTHAWAKVGIMFRENLSPGARHVMAFITPGNHSGLQYRLEPGGASAMGADLWSSRPVWLMLVRAGDTFGGYRSYDGENWTSLGTVNCDLPATAYVGFAVSSHVSGSILTATFDNVELIGVPPPDEPPAAPTSLQAGGATASTVSLTWIDQATNETGFVVERAPGSTETFAEAGAVAADVTTFVDSGLSPNTTYTYRVRARRGALYSTYSNTALITTTAAPPPSNWQGVDIGNVGLTGDEFVIGEGITVDAAGADIWSVADGFRFVYQPWHGDGEIVARVTRFDHTHAWAKAGLMFRESLAAGARNVAFVLTAGNASGLQTRAVTDGTTTFANGPWTTLPHWVRLVRSGDTFTAFTSADGVAWTLRGTQTLAMAAQIYIGFAVSAHTTTVRTTVAFEQVRVPDNPPPPPPPGWTQTALGSGSGSFTSPDDTSLTVTAAGADIWGQFDSGLFVQRAWSGDGEIITRVDSLDPTHAWAKAGVMFRESLAATSPNVFLGLTPTNGVTFQSRLTSSGVTGEVQRSSSPRAPCWLRLTRSGNTFTAAFSIDGSIWTALGSQTLAMPADIFAGFAVSSHATAATTAVFREIQLPDSPPPPPPPPPGWTLTPLGAATGSFTNPTSSAFEVTGTGADLWGQSDSGLFVQRAWTGDGQIVARLDSLVNTHAWAKAGVMFRASLAAGSPNLFLGLTPANGATFQRRSADGGATTEVRNSRSVGVPGWLRLSRAGDVFTAAVSSDGVAWTVLGSETLVLPADVFVGLGVSSHTASTSTSAAFSGVELGVAP